MDGNRKVIRISSNIPININNEFGVTASKSLIAQKFIQQKWKENKMNYICEGFGKYDFIGNLNL